MRNKKSLKKQEVVGVHGIRRVQFSRSEVSAWRAVIVTRSIPRVSDRSARCSEEELLAVRSLLHARKGVESSNQELVNVVCY